MNILHSFWKKFPFESVFLGPPPTPFWDPIFVQITLHWWCIIYNISQGSRSPSQSDRVPVFGTRFGVLGRIGKTDWGTSQNRLPDLGMTRNRDTDLGMTQNREIQIPPPPSFGHTLPCWPNHTVQTNTSYPCIICPHVMPRIPLNHQLQYTRLWGNIWTILFFIFSSLHKPLKSPPIPSPLLICVHPFISKSKWNNKKHHKAFRKDHNTHRRAHHNILLRKLIFAICSRPYLLRYSWTPGARTTGVPTLENYKTCYDGLYADWMALLEEQHHFGAMRKILMTNWGLASDVTITHHIRPIPQIPHIYLIQHVTHRGGTRWDDQHAYF